jgi:hypothetical protein
VHVCVCASSAQTTSGRSRATVLGWSLLLLEPRVQAAARAAGESGWAELAAAQALLWDTFFPTPKGLVSTVAALRRRIRSLLHAVQPALR